MIYFPEVEKSFLKFLWNLKGPQRAETNLEKNNARGFTIPDFKLSNQQCGSGIQTDGQYNRREIWQMTFDKRTQTIQGEKNSVFNTWYWENQVSTCKRIKFHFFLYHLLKKNLKMIYDLNIINIRANYKALRTKHRRKAL